MWHEGLIVADLTNRQLVMHLGAFQIGEGKDMEVKILYITEEVFNSTGNEVQLEQCITKILTRKLNGIKDIYNSFDEARKAIQASKDVWIGLTDKYDKNYVVTVVDDKVVINRYYLGGQECTT